MLGSDGSLPYRIGMCSLRVIWFTTILVWHFGVDGFGATMLLRWWVCYG
uniref:Uncharacterized protein n=1 Tax=Picea sitchensis TaxID=3332 RepID=A0A6B9XS49_PICSI|nr:hypothetical protein Q903MT_gene5564 [Picea sitchensis]